MRSRSSSELYQHAPGAKQAKRQDDLSDKRASFHFLWAWAFSSVLVIIGLPTSSARMQFHVMRVCDPAIAFSFCKARANALALPE